MLTAGEGCKETMLRKASEATAHVAGFGFTVGGGCPSDTSQRFFDSLMRREHSQRIFSAINEASQLVKFG